SDFSAGFCSDAETKAEIAGMFSKGYLMDTHTAVAWHVLRRYRETSGDGTPAVVVSTASPYKFSDSVLEALGEQNKSAGTALLDRLSVKTGTKIPKPLAGLAGRKVRFDGCVEKTEMENVVDTFLNK
ncbi:MAG: threonine synthase, partial [Oscillospiraceae bacterium]